MDIKEFIVSSDESIFIFRTTKSLYKVNIKDQDRLIKIDLKSLLSFQLNKMKTTWLKAAVSTKIDTGVVE